MRNNLVTFFNENEIKEIYENLMEYSLRKYENNDETYKELFKERYESTLKKITSRSNMSDEELINYLNEKQLKYNQNCEENKDIIELYSAVVKNIFIRNIDEDSTDIEKANYLFDFCSNILNYSSDWYEYSYSLPPKDNFDFDFKNNIPASQDIDGLLVLGQGICDDFCNLIQYLGRSIGLNVDKVFVKYNGKPHSINTITIGGRNSIIDITQYIKKELKKEDCFLVSEQHLNRFGMYEFNEIGNTYDIEKNLENPEIYNINQVIGTINMMKPRCTYIPYTNNTKEK